MSNCKHRKLQGISFISFPAAEPKFQAFHASIVRTQIATHISIEPPSEKVCCIRRVEEGRRDARILFNVVFDGD